jgi:hypothetical protein
VPCFHWPNLFSSNNFFVFISEVKLLMFTRDKRGEALEATHISDSYLFFTTKVVSQRNPSNHKFHRLAFLTYLSQRLRRVSCLSEIPHYDLPGILLRTGLLCSLCPHLGLAALIVQPHLQTPLHVRHTTPLDHPSMGPDHDATRVRKCNDGPQRSWLGLQVPLMQDPRDVDYVDCVI